MYFLRKISGLVSGIKTKKTLIEGKTVNYSYHGKFIAINPFSMLRDLSYKGNGIEQKNAGLEIDNLDKFTFNSLPSFGEELNTRVDSKINGNKLSIERRVKKYENIPHTCYDFYFDEIHFGKLIKKYEYGTRFQSTIVSIGDQLGSPQNESQNQLSWANQNQFLIVENFGHTHLTFCFDMELLNRLGNLVS